MTTVAFAKAIYNITQLPRAALPSTFHVVKAAPKWELLQIIDGLAEIPTTSLKAHYEYCAIALHPLRCSQKCKSTLEIAGAPPETGAFPKVHAPKHL